MIQLTQLTVFVCYSLLQAKLKVLREKLIEREQEVAALKASEQEARERLELAEEALDSMRTDMEERREEEQEMRDRLTRYETTLRTEVALLDNEVQKQITDLTNLKKESEDLEVLYIGSLINPSVGGGL